MDLRHPVPGETRHPQQHPPRAERGSTRTVAASAVVVRRRAAAAAAVIIIFGPRSKRFIIYDNAERSDAATAVAVHHCCAGVAAAMDRLASSRFELCEDWQHRCLVSTRNYVKRVFHFSFLEGTPS